MLQWIGSALVQIMACRLFRRQSIIWTNAGLLSIGLFGTKFSEIWIEILSFSIKKMQMKMLSAKLAAILSTGRWVKSVPVLRSGSLPCLPLHKYSWWSRLDLMYHITQGRGTGTVFICCAAVWSQFSRNACHSSTYDIHQGAPHPTPNSPGTPQSYAPH